MTNHKTDNNKAAEKKIDPNIDSVDDIKSTTSSKSASTSTSTPNKSIQKNMTKKVGHSSKTKVSKTSIVAIALSLTALGLIAGLFYFDKQERIALSQQLVAKSNQNNNDIQQKITQLLSKHQIGLLQQLDLELNAVKKENQDQLIRLSNTVEKLKQNQPSDWLVHEAEYLIRIAGRSLWLERDTKAAIALLTDADNRLKSLNDPNYLLVRQAVNEDIEALKLVPQVKAEETILTLMAMSKKIGSLRLKMADIPESVEEVESFELSNDATDWRENLAKTWKKFLADFITVNRRTTNVEPLMSVDAQQNLRENLRLKLQVAQWAVSKEKQQLYLQNLADIESWLNDYFIIDNSINVNFIKGINKLKGAKITFDYEQGLSSLNMIRAMMTVPSSSSVPTSDINKATNENKSVDENSTSKAVADKILNNTVLNTNAGEI